MGSSKKDKEVDEIALYIDDSKDWKQVVHHAGVVLGIKLEDLAKNLNLILSLCLFGTF